MAACVNTLRVVAERYRLVGESAAEVLRRERARSLRTYRKRLLRFGVLGESDESDMAELEVDGMAADLRQFRGRRAGGADAHRCDGRGAWCVDPTGGGG